MVVPSSTTVRKSAKLWTLIWPYMMIACFVGFLFASAAWAFSIYHVPHFLPSCFSPSTWIFLKSEALLSDRNITLIEEEEEVSSLQAKQILADDNETLVFVERNEWLAQPPTESPMKLHLPVPYVIISHSATTSCFTRDHCTIRMRFIQQFHIESRHWSDIAYNFLIGGDGLVYVGRDWDHVGAHTFGFNNRSIGISVIGRFRRQIPPRAQLIALRKLIEIGVKTGKISPDYKLLGQGQVGITTSPGNAFYDIIKTWPHWSPTVI